MDCATLSRDWFSYLTGIGLPFATLLIAASVAYFAFLQWKTNKEKLRLDLYNRRFEIYVRTLEFYAALSDYKPTDNQKEFQEIRLSFFKSYREAQFLFDENSGIYKMLLRLHRISFKITGFKEDGKTLADSGCHEELTKMNEEAHDNMMMFAIYIEELEKAISPYLNFHKIAT